MNGQEHEIEAKFLLVRHMELESRLHQLKARLIQARTHEINLRFDTPEKTLSRSHQVLRLRRDAIVRLTYKGASQEDVPGGILSRREIEISVDDFDQAQLFLEALGYNVILFYEKYRTIYELNQTQVMLDELPFGHFIEIEGADPAQIRLTADMLGLHWRAAIEAGYQTLFERLVGRFALDEHILSFKALQGVQILPEDLGVIYADQD